MRRWLKIKRKKDEAKRYRVFLQWGEGREETIAITHHLSSAEPPAEGFLGALVGLIQPVLALLELPDSYGAGMEVVGVSFTHEEERGRGAVVTCLKSVAGAQSPVVLNTPYLPETAADENSPTLPAALASAIEALCDEAERYLDGEREQLDLLTLARETAEDLRDGLEEGESVTISSPGHESVTLHGRRPALVRG